MVVMMKLTVDSSQCIIVIETTASEVLSHGFFNQAVFVARLTDLLLNATKKIHGNITSLLARER